MKIRNQFDIAAPLDETWAALNDIPRVARCAPGAELLEARDDGSYLGAVAVKLGPIALRFKGTVVFVDKDEAAHRVVAKAKGNEEKARGSANADVAFALTSVEAKTRVTVDSDITLVGAVAQYARGAAIIQGTAQAIMDQFARNLEADLAGAEPADRDKAISATGALAKGLWSAGAGLLRKKEQES